MPTNFISEEEKEGKASIWSYVHLVTLLKIEGAMFSFIKTPEGITNLQKTIYALLSNFWISGFTRFFAPPRPGPPRGFSSSPRPADFRLCPAPLEKGLPRTSLLNMHVPKREKVTNTFAMIHYLLSMIFQ